MRELYGSLSPTQELTGKIEDAPSLTGSAQVDSMDISGNIIYTVLKGASAYELAVKNGFVGTEVEWLDSLKSTNSALSHYIKIGDYVFDGTENIVIPIYDGEME